ncbi:MAG: phosphomannomutase/phosphoglucomutase [Legionellales bacterium]|nr:phosphomannomutase/phosphoglucomutase [Legionellales bacterium]
MLISKEIFRAYDIRGIVDIQLNADTIYLLGQAIGTEVLAQGGNTIITGRDGRLSGPVLLAALQQGLLSTGCDIIDIGMVPTPVLYFATHTLKSNSGSMLTGSHNPANYNGIKPVINGRSLTPESLLKLYDCIQNKAFSTGQGSLTTTDVTENYLSHITDHIKLKRPVKLVIDCANGATGNIAPELFSRLGCDVIPMYTEVDGRFPNHHPDPSAPENLQDLIVRVRTEKADLGFAFDGDGDRLGVVTNEGEIIWPDRQLAFFAKDILSRHPGTPVVYDVKCSSHLTNIVKQCGGQPIMYKTGHSLIKNKMIEEKALLSGEMSGHIYFKERWFGFDDGLYTGARLLEIFTAQSLSSADLFRTIPSGVNTPELKLAMNEDLKFGFIDTLVKNADFPDAEMTTIDGLRVDFEDGWGLVRASNTTPHLILRFEAINQASLDRIKAVFRDLLLAQDKTLKLPF